MASSPHVQRSSSVFRNVKREVKAADTTIDEYGNRVEVRIRQTCVVSVRVREGKCKGERERERESAKRCSEEWG